MTNITILQPKDQSASSTVTLPNSFIALKAGIGSEPFFQVLQQFFESKGHRVLGKLRGLEAAEVADFFDELIMVKLRDHPEPRRHTMYILRNLCASWGVLPAPYTLQGEVKVTEKIPWTCTRFGEVWRGTWGPEKVAVKVIKITGAADPEKLKKQLSKEAVIWKYLEHRNILPLYGVSTSIKTAGFEYEHPCLVSPWMGNGNIRKFVRNNPTFNRFDLLVDVCEGLMYLHSQGFVHGDLKGDNVLVDDENRARLADFGFAGVCVSFGLAGTSNSSDVGGTATHMAPELLVHQATKDPSTIPPPKKPVDVYALGTLIHEVLAGQQPFRGCNRDVIKSFAVNGNRPERPPWSSIPGHQIWNTVELCWRHDPAERPQLEEILRSLTSADTPPPEWPSPPATPSTPSITNSPPVPPTPLITAAVVSHPPTPPTPEISITELSPWSHCSPSRIPAIVLPRSHLPRRRPPLLYPLLTLFTLETVNVRLAALQNNPMFRWRVAGGGVTKQQSGAANRKNQ